MEMLQYIGLSGVGILLFYLLARLLMPNSTLFTAQRYYYIVAIVASLILPLLTLCIPMLQERMAESALPSFAIVIDEEPIVTAEATATKKLDWIKAVNVTWGVGIIVTALWLLIGYLRINKLRRHSIKRRIDTHTTLYLTKEEVAPFTLGHSIFIPQSIEDDTIISSVLSHEWQHISQKHYIDITIGISLQLLQWWNPCAWSLLQQQRNTLEYLADQGVLRMGKDRKAYQYDLLKCTIGKSIRMPSLSFSMLNLKQRIFMMNKNNKTRKSKAIIYAMASLPVLFILVVGTQLVKIEEAKAATADTSMPTPPPTNDKDEVYTFLEEMPEFNGGNAEMMKWLGNHVKYPQMAIDGHIEGRVIVKFVVEKDGSISNVSVIKSIHESLDKEAVRLVSSMPNWKPGVKDGKPVRCSFIVPIQFKLQGEEVDDKVYEYVDEMPEFIGGIGEMMKWLGHNLQYPKEAEATDAQGRVIVSFIVEKDGSINEVKVVQSVHEALDNEAVRVVSSMPKWTPGMKDGKPIRCKFTLPVQFTLQEDKETPAEK